MNKTTEPFLKWAGGKRWLVTKHSDLLPDKSQFNKYYEPFLGGGAVFFHVNPREGRLSDLNFDLINLYRILKDEWKVLHDLLREYQNRHNKEFYYELRSSKPQDNIYQAARFLYLNRTCWNGLYRVNKFGEFNVPIGTKNKILFQNESFEKISSCLKNMDIVHCDFEDTMNQAAEGDFIFIDPPYTIKHNNNGFIKYNENLFSWDDQIRLREITEKCIQRGVKIIATNAYHESLLELYKNIGESRSLLRYSVISGKTENRGLFNELLIKSF